MPPYDFDLFQATSQLLEFQLDAHPVGRETAPQVIVNDVQPVNAYDPIVSTVFGI